jgi:dolichyl-phosphate beta-glucosyltransferase
MSVKRCIVIPFYNEENRFNLVSFTSFCNQYKDVKLCLVDDGSSDQTLDILSAFKKGFPTQVHLISQEKNKGKGEAVFTGVQWALSTPQYRQIAFMDADLSTPFEECIRLFDLLDDKRHFVFGSRIKKIDNQIERKWYRFFMGRIFATLVSTLLKLPIYDTQCGCKVFTSQYASIAFASPFLSRWIFDIEIFFRLKQHFGTAHFIHSTEEVPLLKWIDGGDTRIAPSYAFTVWKDLFTIYTFYNTKSSPKKQ